MSVAPIFQCELNCEQLCDKLTKKSLLIESWEIRNARQRQLNKNEIMTSIIADNNGEHNLLLYEHNNARLGFAIVLIYIE